MDFAQENAILAYHSIKVVLHILNLADSKNFVLGVEMGGV
jgi:hypothetical protein